MKNLNNDKNYKQLVPGLNKYQCLLNITCTKVEVICNSGQQFYSPIISIFIKLILNTPNKSKHLSKLTIIACLSNFSCF